MSVFLQRQTVKKHRRWAERLRRLERILLSMLIVVAGLAALYGVYRLVFLGPAFAIEKIVVEGDWKYLDPEEVAGLSGVSRGDNLFWISVAGIHARLAEEPWVRQAAVRRRLPDTLWIYVEEYRPVAIVSSENLYYVDAHGELFKRIDSSDDKDLPLITGIGIRDGVAEGDEDRQRLKEALALIDAFKASRFGNHNGVSEVNHDARRGYSIVTGREPMQLLIGHTDHVGRIRKIDRMGRSIAARQGRIQYMLADEDGKITVRYRPA